MELNTEILLELRSELMTYALPVTTIDLTEISMK